MRTLLISGASRGIGRAVAERALADGHRLSLGLRDLEALKQTPLDPALAGSDKVLLCPYAAEDPAAAQAWVEATSNYFGGFDSVIHNAGIFSRVPLLFESGEEQEIAHIIDVNLMGPWWLTRAAWPQLASHGEGRIQVLVSMSGKRSKGRLAAYSASKFALLGLCQTMRNEGWAAGIRVTAICPGWVNTDMAAAVRSGPSDRWPTQSMEAEAMTQPEDIASMSAELLRLPNRAVPFELAVSSSLE
ncbi:MULTISPECIES: SDR family NAD(P)-dependent oxidoreductase [unclassified Synechococcus]|uniref:SDR family NAD(P)-dependent oxidoreductase n=1 Tax=unclassified Synechococcus TaxID=2626047 RepID=UPI0006528500|nr:SDR family NAD(P)-dependent oxidoreductase [Synechococcus sp. WH 8020]AKN61512.1 short-chain dehydrogenase [Synechococcus sp. WH 8020]